MSEYVRERGEEKEGDRGKERGRERERVGGEGGRKEREYFNIQTTFLTHCMYVHVPAACM